MQLTHQDAFAVLCVQAADEGRGPVLFGDSIERVRDVVGPFLVGDLFPEIYFEFPLAGDPFLDVTVLLGSLAPGTRIDSPLAEGTGAVLDFYSRAREQDDGIAFGFELDCGKDAVPAAALHFQPRNNKGLVVPFCASVGEPERADLYLAQDDRMPEGWDLSFFGLFRGRPGFPLRVCGYFDEQERLNCATDPARIERAFAQAGFAACAPEMCAQVAQALSLAPQSADFQFDVFPDGSLGDSFAVDLSFDRMPSDEIRESFAHGAGAMLVAQLKEWGIADSRVDLVPDMAFTRALLMEHDDGTTRGYAFVLAPGWLKVRWRNGVLQPAKMYLRAHAGFIKDDE
ncbi:MAG: hypothetical protein IJ131_08540 [Eggerthellaceae bacterium]|nr:hypothetical protein [Eggerthellaceae bacterium]